MHAVGCSWHVRLYMRALAEKHRSRNVEFAFWCEPATCDHMKALNASHKLYTVFLRAINIYSRPVIADHLVSLAVISSLR